MTRGKMMIIKDNVIHCIVEDMSISVVFDNDKNFSELTIDV